MRHFILDTNIIIQNPGILAKGNDEIRFVIPEPVIIELASFEHLRKSGEQILDLVNNALLHNAFLLSVSSKEIVALQEAKSTASYRVNPSDSIIAISVEYYQKHLFPDEADNIFFVTDDKSFAQHIKAVGVKTIGSHELETELRNSSVTNQDIRHKASVITLLQRKELIIGVILGILVSLVGNLVAANYYIILTSINIWGTILLIPISGVLLYWLRSKNRLAYGIAEVLFGLLTGLRVFIPNFDYSQLDTTGFIQIAGSLYIMVRGMDNIGKSIIGTRFEVVWKRYFGES